MFSPICEQLKCFQAMIWSRLIPNTTLNVQSHLLLLNWWHSNRNTCDMKFLFRANKFPTYIPLMFKVSQICHADQQHIRAVLHTSLHCWQWKHDLFLCQAWNLLTFRWWDLKGLNILMEKFFFVLRFGYKRSSKYLEHLDSTHSVKGSVWMNM